jgi:CRP-like cAMP-binding protein
VPARSSISPAKDAVVTACVSSRIAPCLVTDSAGEWRAAGLFAGLPADALDAIAPLLRQESVPANAVVFAEGDESDRLCLLLDGELDVLLGADLVWLASLGPGEHFGEMGVVSGARRGATIRARTASRIAFLDRAALDMLRDHHGVDVLGGTMRHHAETLDVRLRATNAQAAERMRLQTLAQQDQIAFGRVFANIILVIFIYISLIDVLRAWAAEGASTTLTSSSLMVGMAIGAALIIRQSKFPREVFGLTLKGWRHSVHDSLKWTAVACAVLTAVKAVLIAVIPAYAGLDLIDPWQSAAGWRHTVMAYALYTALSPVQEFIIRGAIQGALQRLLSERGGVWQAILLSNAIFSICHQHMGVGYALAAFVPGLFWGWLYHRQGSLVGVSVSHVVIGLWVTGALNLAAMVG